MAKLHQLESLHGISMYLCYDCPVSLIKIRHKKSVKPIDWLGEVDWLKSECTVVSVFSIHCVWTWGIPWQFHAEYDHEIPQTRWKFGCAPFSNKPWFPCLTFRLTSECATQHASLWHPFFGQQQLQLNQWIRWCWLVVEPYPLKNDGARQLGWLFHSQLNGKIIQMFQTTNQPPFIVDLWRLNCPTFDCWLSSIWKTRRRMARERRGAESSILQDNILKMYDGRREE